MNHLCNGICGFADSEKLELGRARETICDAWRNIQTAAIWISLKLSRTDRPFKSFTVQAKKLSFLYRILQNTYEVVVFFFSIATLCKLPSSDSRASIVLSINS